jgi:predicted dehydrogenase/threonine dehydrogenase-like Zn-dependent dehydrogenase
MKQIIQDLGSGGTRLVDVARPAPSRGTLVIDSTASLISIGTEKMLVEFGNASLVGKVRQQPERVAEVFAKVKSDGLLTTVDAVRSKLAQPIPLGYANVGVVAEVGSGVAEIRAGDRVVSNGSHAETVRVPANLVARIPDDVSDEAAAFTVVASIGLQGIRLIAPTLGESVAVVGVGLIGLLTVQMLVANGCRVLAIDFDETKLALARRYGAKTCNPANGEDPVAVGLAFSAGVGMDGVLITASTTSNEPIRQAAQMSRKRGRIVLVGVIGLELSRADFYEKELSFQVSCSYGPGRYDPDYEERGNDYPIGFVRWTERRNFEAVLALMAQGKIDVSDLISHRFAIEAASAAYEVITSKKGALGVLLTYGSPPAERAPRSIVHAVPRVVTGPVLGVIGAGNYATRVLIPAFQAAGATFGPIVTSAGLSGSIAADKFGFATSTTDIQTVLDDPAVTAIAIATRHDSHADLVAASIVAGKDVFCEKPLAIDSLGLDKVRAALDAQRSDAGSRLMVGFNRRWAPMVRKMKSLLSAEATAKSFVMTVNAGVIPAAHWTQDQTSGGGRIVGEACHFVDLLRFLADAPITNVTARAMGATTSMRDGEDKAFIILDFADGSHGVIHYLGNGSASFPKERLEVFCSGKILQMDNYRKLVGFGWTGFRKMSSIKQDKGQAGCAAAFWASIVNGTPSPISLEEILEVSARTIEAVEQIRAT